MGITFSPQKEKGLGKRKLALASYGQVSRVKLCDSVELTSANEFNNPNPSSGVMETKEMR